MTTTLDKEALLYDPLDGHRVHCHLCAHECVIPSGKFGFCRVRQNVEGTLFSRNYGRLVAANVDPIEKKPLYHVLPGTASMSVGSPGCNFRCAFCQNWQISQVDLEGRHDAGQIATPEQVVQAAQRKGCSSISYTYTEPTIFFEFALETAELARKAGLKNCFVSNGYMTPAAVRTIAPVLDAVNVDLKAFRDETYRSVMKARLDPVLTCLRELVAAGVWVEVTTLVVPGMNDSPPELKDIAQFIATDLGVDVPWHVSRYHDDYQMADRGATPLETLALACRLAREAGLRYVYQGNVLHDGSDTTCPSCGRIVVARGPMRLRSLHLRGGACEFCRASIPGLWA